MADDAHATWSTVIPGLRYRDAPAAIEWLCRAFGFERRLVVPGETAGTIAHAQLAFRSGMVMLGSADSHGGNAFDRLVRPPADLGGRGSQGVYVVVEDADTHHARAVAAGAEIVLDLVDQPYGGRGYTCRDPEGHVWSFGTYDPWASQRRSGPASDTADLPDVAALLASILGRVPRERQPLLVAIAERMAARRYRAWAAGAAGERYGTRLLACADREERIAGRIEALHPEAAAVQRDLRAENPDLEDVNRSLFEGRPLRQQLAIQAQGERLGAATWRAFAAHADGVARETFLVCADLEEENARALEAIVADGSLKAILDG
jgi:uncharacterized glyoxalase superfamily protein PhnB